MRLGIKIFLFTALLTGFISCGADKLKPQNVTSQLGLSSGQTCSCNSTYSPVCAGGIKNYENICLAQCHGDADLKVGHCVCSNELIVCGSDNLNHTECDAVGDVANNKYQITKFVPCNSTEI